MKRLPPGEADVALLHSLSTGDATAELSRARCMTVDARRGRMRTPERGVMVRGVMRVWFMAPLAEAAGRWLMPTFITDAGVPPPMLGVAGSAP